MEEIYRYIDNHADEFVETLQRFCRQPSISSEGLGIREMVGILENEMKQIGIETTVHETAGNPLVTGIVRAEKGPTLMFYNHYDVQPPDPLEKWDSPPFAAEIRDGRVWARGATDNKGNILSRLKALEAFLKVKGKPPLTVKFLHRGEGERGELQPRRVDGSRPTRGVFRRQGSDRPAVRAGVDGDQELHGRRRLPDGGRRAGLVAGRCGPDRPRMIAVLFWSGSFSIRMALQTG